ncbi:hypothetical protein ACFRJ3_34990 [Streptomyces sp. NPDC056696]|uniref:hypothetical protein n=1 Tax=unclassified Streptomyces TaxID=2593676 RepID=UPI003662C3DE
MTVEFQVSWSRETPGQTHVSFSGDRTPCNDGLHVIEAKPFYASKLKDVDCHVCGAFVLFDIEPARTAARNYVNDHPATAKWEIYERFEFASSVTERAAGVAFAVQREHGRWNSNHAFSEFMAGAGLMTDKSADAGLIGMTALAVFEALKEREVSK